MRQPSPPLRHWPIVGQGWAEPPSASTARHRRLSKRFSSLVEEHLLRMIRQVVTEFCAYALKSLLQQLIRQYQGLNSAPQIAITPGDYLVDGRLVLIKKTVGVCA